MTSGFVFGKFMPLHYGHLSLINFAKKNCGTLYVVLCYTRKEAIPGDVRSKWLKKKFESKTDIIIISFYYDENRLPNSSISSRVISRIWAKEFKKLLPPVDYVFTSEDYGNYLAEFMNVEHFLFDKDRLGTSVSGSIIRQNPFKWWDYIADVAKYFYVKKISILGSESTGKSTLTEKIATHYQTTFVSETGREIVETTALCELEDLNHIVLKHAEKINEQLEYANKILIIDTDINITKSYASFLFGKKLVAEAWQERANKSDLYFFLETDCPYIQDGTRLGFKSREQLSLSHKEILKVNKINYIQINGTWEERFQKICHIINEKYFTE